MPICASMKESVATSALWTSKNDDKSEKRRKKKGQKTEGRFLFHGKNTRMIRHRAVQPETREFRFHRQGKIRRWVLRLLIMGISSIWVRPWPSVMRVVMSTGTGSATGMRHDRNAYKAAMDKPPWRTTNCSRWLPGIIQIFPRYVPDIYRIVTGYSAKVRQLFPRSFLTFCPMPRKPKLSTKPRHGMWTALIS